MFFPYDHISSFEKLEETKLPTKAQFYNRLNNSHITDEEYERATRVWNSFNCKTLKDYLKLYLLSDILILTDVYENFRKTMMETYKLDPCHYISLPGYSWDAMLKYTDVNLELLTDIDQVLFFTKMIRGGISQCSSRYSECNNTLAGNRDPTKPDTYILL